MILQIPSSFIKNLVFLTQNRKVTTITAITRVTTITATPKKPQNKQKTKQNKKTKTNTTHTHTHTHTKKSIMLRLPSKLHSCWINLAEKPNGHSQLFWVHDCFAFFTNNDCQKIFSLTWFWTRKI